MTRPALLDVNQIAEQLGTSVRHIRRLVFERRIPYVKVGGSLRFDPRRIDEWLDENTTEARPPA